MSTVRMPNRHRDLAAVLIVIDRLRGERLLAGIVLREHELALVAQDLCPACAIETPKKSSKREDSIKQLEATNRKLDELAKQIENVKTS